MKRLGFQQCRHRIHNVLVACSIGLVIHSLEVSHSIIEVITRAYQTEQDHPTPVRNHPPHLYSQNYSSHVNTNEIATTTSNSITSPTHKSNLDNSCHHFTAALNVSSWPDVVYHKDRPDDTNDYQWYDTRKFSSLQEDDTQARQAITEFNKIRSSVLTSSALEAGFSSGGIFPTISFARRMLAQFPTSQTHNSEQQLQHQRSLVILVFGNSFTIGSNCGESSAQPSSNCAWPARLQKRFQNILPNNTVVEWKMYQENAQGSVNIAQKIPSILHEFHSRNITPDAILLDTTITDSNFGVDPPWFEAIVRAFMQAFPAAIIVSLVDAIPPLTETESDFTEWLSQVQAHYGLTVINFPKMVQYLRHHNVSDYIVQSFYENQPQHHIPEGNGIDVLWPQASYMVSPNGTILDDGVTDVGEVYWANFIPKMRKTMHAYYPENHPHWVTHQYVADTVMYALLKVMMIGLGCAAVAPASFPTVNDNGEKLEYFTNLSSNSFISPVPDPQTTLVSLDTTVSPTNRLDSCFICRSPLTLIDAKSPRFAGHNIINLTASNSDGSETDHNYDTVAVTCGDWKWITDDRSRSGWQSDQYGSIIRFRLRVSEKKLPTISITYMKSHDMFGNLRVTFQTVTRKEAKSKDSHSSTPFLGCDDVEKFMNNSIPFFDLEGYLPQYSLWETTIFPAVNEYYDVVTKGPWDLLNKTVLSHILASSLEDENENDADNSNATTDDNPNDDIVEYVDLYVMNPNTHNPRIKIQVVSSC